MANDARTVSIVEDSVAILMNRIDAHRLRKWIQITQSTSALRTRFDTPTNELMYWLGTQLDEVGR